MGETIHNTKSVEYRLLIRIGKRQEAKGGIDNQSLITRFSIKRYRIAGSREKQFITGFLRLDWELIILLKTDFGYCKVWLFVTLYAKSTDKMPR